MERREFLKALTVGAAVSTFDARRSSVLANEPLPEIAPRIASGVEHSLMTTPVPGVEAFDMPRAGIRTDTRTAVTKNGEIYVGGGGFLWRSVDRGATWTQRKLPIRAAGGFGILNGDIFVLISYSDDHSINSVQRSTDYGETWSLPTPLDIAPYDYGGGGWSHVYQHPNGSAMITVTLRNKATKYQFHDHVYRSHDGGRTWGDRTLLIPYSAESSLLALGGSKRMLAYSRAQRRLLPDDPAEFWRQTGTTEGNPWPLKNGVLAESNDGGRTWANLRMVDTYGSVPGEVIQTLDGRVAALWLLRYPYVKAGIRVRISDDDGRTWGKQTYALCGGHGYPSSVVFADGTIVTACESTKLTSRGRPDGERTMGAVRWRLPQATGGRTSR